MGWASGSRMMSGIAAKLIAKVPDEASRYEIYRILITEFEEMDCDTLDECRGDDPALDRALADANKEWREKHGYDEDDD